MNMHKHLLLFCNICNKSYNNQKLLDQHYLVHNEVIQTYDCSECPRKFLHQYQLKKHEEFHLSSKSDFPLSKVVSSSPKTTKMSKNQLKEANTIEAVNHHHNNLQKNVCFPENSLKEPSKIAQKQYISKESCYSQYLNQQFDVSEICGDANVMCEVEVIDKTSQDHCKNELQRGSGNKLNINSNLNVNENNISDKSNDSMKLNNKLASDCEFSSDSNVDDSCKSSQHNNKKKKTKKPVCVASRSENSSEDISQDAIPETSDEEYLPTKEKKIRSHYNKSLKKEPGRKRNNKKKLEDSSENCSDDESQDDAHTAPKTSDEEYLPTKEKKIKGHCIKSLKKEPGRKRNNKKKLEDSSENSSKNESKDDALETFNEEYLTTKEKKIRGHYIKSLKQVLDRKKNKKRKLEERPENSSDDESQDDDHVAPVTSDEEYLPTIEKKVKGHYIKSLKKEPDRKRNKKRKEEIISKSKLIDRSNKLLVTSSSKNKITSGSSHQKKPCLSLKTKRNILEKDFKSKKTSDVHTSNSVDSDVENVKVSLKKRNAKKDKDVENSSSSESSTSNETSENDSDYVQSEIPVSSDEDYSPEVEPKKRKLTVKNPQIVSEKSKNEKVRLTVKELQVVTEKSENEKIMPKRKTRTSNKIRIRKRRRSSKYLNLESFLNSKNLIGLPQSSKNKSENSVTSSENVTNLKMDGLKKKKSNLSPMEKALLLRKSMNTDFRFEMPKELLLERQRSKMSALNGQNKPPMKRPVISAAEMAKRLRKPSDLNFKFEMSEEILLERKKNKLSIDVKQKLFDQKDLEKNTQQKDPAGHEPNPMNILKSKSSSALLTSNSNNEEKTDNTNIVNPKINTSISDKSTISYKSLFSTKKGLHLPTFNLFNQKFLYVGPEKNLNKIQSIIGELEKEPVEKARQFINKPSADISIFIEDHKRLIEQRSHFIKMASKNDSIKSKLEKTQKNQNLSESSDSNKSMCESLKNSTTSTLTTCSLTSDLADVDKTLQTVTNDSFASKMSEVPTSLKPNMKTITSETNLPNIDASNQENEDILNDVDFDDSSSSSSLEVGQKDDLNASEDILEQDTERHNDDCDNYSGANDIKKILNSLIHKVASMVPDRKKVSKCYKSDFTSKQNLPKDLAPKNVNTIESNKASVNILSENVQRNQTLYSDAHSNQSLTMIPKPINCDVKSYLNPTPTVSSTVTPISVNNGCLVSVVPNQLQVPLIPVMQNNNTPFYHVYPQNQNISLLGTPSSNITIPSNVISPNFVSLPSPSVNILTSDVAVIGSTAISPQNMCLLGNELQLPVCTPSSNLMVQSTVLNQNIVNPSSFNINPPQFNSGVLASTAVIAKNTSFIRNELQFPVRTLSSTLTVQSKPFFKHSANLLSSKINASTSVAKELASTAVSSGNICSVGQLPMQFPISSTSVTAQSNASIKNDVSSKINVPKPNAEVIACTEVRTENASFIGNKLQLPVSNAKVLTSTAVGTENASLIGNELQSLVCTPSTPTAQSKAFSEINIDLSSSKTNTSKSIAKELASAVSPKNMCLIENELQLSDKTPSSSLSVESDDFSQNLVSSSNSQIGVPKSNAEVFVSRAVRPENVRLIENKVKSLGKNPFASVTVQSNSASLSSSKISTVKSNPKLLASTAIGFESVSLNENKIQLPSQTSNSNNAAKSNATGTIDPRIKASNVTKPTTSSETLLSIQGSKLQTSNLCNKKFLYVGPEQNLDKVESVIVKLEKQPAEKAKQLINKPPLSISNFFENHKGIMDKKVTKNVALFKVTPAFINEMQNKLASSKSVDLNKLIQKSVENSSTSISTIPSSTSNKAADVATSSQAVTSVPNTLVSKVSTSLIKSGNLASSITNTQKSNAKVLASTAIRPKDVCLTRNKLQLPNWTPSTSIKISSDECINNNVSSSRTNTLRSNAKVLGSITVKPESIHLPGKVIQLPVRTNSSVLSDMLRQTGDLEVFSKSNAFKNSIAKIPLETTVIPVSSSAALSSSHECDVSYSQLPDCVPKNASETLTVEDRFSSEEENGISDITIVDVRSVKDEEPKFKLTPKVLQVYKAKLEEKERKKKEKYERKKKLKLMEKLLSKRFNFESTVNKQTFQKSTTNLNLPPENSHLKNKTVVANQTPNSQKSLQHRKTYDKQSNLNDDEKRVSVRSNNNIVYLNLPSTSKDHAIDVHETKQKFAQGTPLKRLERICFTLQGNIKDNVCLYGLNELLAIIETHNLWKQCHFVFKTLRYCRLHTNNYHVKETALYIHKKITKAINDPSIS